MKVREPSPGDLIEVFWRDVQGDDGGAPAEARPATRSTPGYYIGWFDDVAMGRYLAVQKTKDLDTVTTNTGWDAYPAGTVLAIIVLKRVAWYRKWYDIIKGVLNVTSP